MGDLGIGTRDAANVGATGGVGPAADDSPKAQAGALKAKLDEATAKGDWKTVQATTEEIRTLFDSGAIAKDSPEAQALTHGLVESAGKAVDADKWGVGKYLLFFIFLFVDWLSPSDAKKAGDLSKEVSEHMSKPPPARGNGSGAQLPGPSTSMGGVNTSGARSAGAADLQKAGANADMLKGALQGNLLEYRGSSPLTGADAREFDAGKAQVKKKFEDVSRALAANPPDYAKAASLLKEIAKMPVVGRMNLYDKGFVSDPSRTFSVTGSEDAGTRPQLDNMIKQMEFMGAMQKAGVANLQFPPTAQNLTDYFGTLKGHPAEALSAWKTVSTTFFVDGYQLNPQVAVDYQPEHEVHANGMAAMVTSPNALTDVVNPKLGSNGGRTVIDCDGYSYLAQKLLGAAGYKVNTVACSNPDNDAAHVVTVFDAPTQPPSRVLVSSMHTITPVQNRKQAIMDNMYGQAANKISFGKSLDEASVNAANHKATLVGLGP